MQTNQASKGQSTKQGQVKFQKLHGPYISDSGKRISAAEKIADLAAKLSAARDVLESQLGLAHPIMNATAYRIDE